MTGVSQDFDLSIFHGNQVAARIKKHFDAELLMVQKSCQTAESTINKSLIEDLLGTFLLVQQELSR